MHQPARQARAEGAKLILTGRTREKLEKFVHELDARMAAFEATGAASVDRFAVHLMTKYGADRRDVRCGWRAACEPLLV